MFQWLYILILFVFNFRVKQKCNLNTRLHFSDPLPVILRDDSLLEPTDDLGNIEMNEGDQLKLSCGRTASLRHPNMKSTRATDNITCVFGSTFVNDDWLTGPSVFDYFTCSDAPEYESRQTNRTCYHGFPVLEVGYDVEDNFYPLYESCFNVIDLRVVYTKYTQRPYNAHYQTKIKRPYFIDDNNFHGLPVNYLMSPRGQKEAVYSLLGFITNSYITDTEFLARGHLSAKTDFVLAFGERATFHYVNCAPQWNGLNGGNWNTLEVDLRNHVSAKKYDTIIYCGTYGVSYLRNDKNESVDLYLHFNHKEPVMPVPLYFYKVIYEPKSLRGTVFIGINNPYLSLEEAKELFFCEDICRKQGVFRWLTWNADRPQDGYAFCCTVNDFRDTVRHLPDFEVTDVLP